MKTFLYWCAPCNEMTFHYTKDVKLNPKCVLCTSPKWQKWKDRLIIETLINSIPGVKT
jgi:hypothetical protein